MATVNKITRSFPSYVDPNRPFSKYIVNWLILMFVIIVTNFLYFSTLSFFYRSVTQRCKDETRDSFVTYNYPRTNQAAYSP